MGIVDVQFFETKSTNYVSIYLYTETKKSWRKEEETFNALSSRQRRFKKLGTSDAPAYESSIVCFESEFSKPNKPHTKYKKLSKLFGQ